jgi:hypothetical protein
MALLDLNVACEQHILIYGEIFYWKKKVILKYIKNEIIFFLLNQTFKIKYTCNQIIFITK